MSIIYKKPLTPSDERRLLSDLTKNRFKHADNKLEKYAKRVIYRCLDSEHIDTALKSAIMFMRTRGDKRELDRMVRRARKVVRVTSTSHSDLVDSYLKEKEEKHGNCAPIESLTPRLEQPPDPSSPTP